MFSSGRWSGKDLLNKIQWISFLVLYLMFPFILNLLKKDKEGDVPTDKVLIFIFVIIGIFCYVLLIGWITERVLRRMSEKFAGKRVLIGSIDEGGGKGEDFEFIIKDMFAYEILPEFEKSAVERVESGLYEHELQLITENKGEEEEDAF